MPILDNPNSGIYACIQSYERQTYRTARLRAEVLPRDQPTSHAHRDDGENRGSHVERVDKWVIAQLDRRMEARLASRSFPNLWCAGETRDLIPCLWFPSFIISSSFFPVEISAIATVSDAIRCEVNQKEKREETGRRAGFI